MADINLYIPFIIRWEVGLSLPDESNEALFEEARKSRQAFTDNPLDRGGATMCGVTLATYRTYRGRAGLKPPTVAELRDITYSDWHAIVTGLFWDRWRASEIICQAVAEALVDWVWTSGSPGIRIPQRLLGVKADGIAGPLTLDAVAKADTGQLFASIQAARETFVRGIVASRPSQRVWLNGWLNRIRSLTDRHAGACGRCES